MKNDMTPQALAEYGAKLKTFCCVAAVALLAVLTGSAAFGQATPTVTFGSSVTNANGSLTTVNTWSTTPAAASCTASGHPSWTGTKAASGTQTLPAITLSGSYTLTLACTWPGDSQAIVSWTAPTTNTDGSALAKCPTQTTAGPCLQYFRVYRATNSTLTNPEVTPVDNANATSYTFQNLSANTHYFSVEVVNGDGIPSKLATPFVSKTITSGTSRTASVTLTVNPVPSPAGNLAAN